MANYIRVADVFESGPVVRAKKCRVGFAMLILICVQGAGAKSAWGQGNNPQSRSVREILTDSQLWGKDFPTVLASISSWNHQFEQRFAIFPTRALGTTPYHTPAEAERVAASLKSLLRPNDKLRGAVVPWFEDSSFRVAIDGEALELLPREFSLEMIKKRLGAPERITTVVITGNTEHRPTVLLLYSYAGGAVVYAESAYSPFPGRINRVFLDLNITG